MNGLNLNSVVKDYPLLNKQGTYMILHTDLDALLSGLIQHDELGTVPIGIYNLKTLSIDKEILKLGPEKVKEILQEQTVFIDLDIAYEGLFSVGHHIVKNKEKHLNPNLLIGYYEDKFNSKYPLNMAIFLTRIYNRPLPKTDLGKLLLLQGDNVWKNYYGHENKGNKNYKENVLFWLNQFEMYELIDFLERCDRGIEIKNRIHPILEKYIYRNSNYENYQCNFNVKNGKLQFDSPKGNIQSLVDEMADILEFKKMLLPESIEIYQDFQVFEIKSDKKIYIEPTLERFVSGIKEKCRIQNNCEVEVKIFSYSLTNSKKLKITYYVKRIPLIYT